MATHAVFIDPPSTHFLENRLFDTADAALNRDGTLEPFVRMRDALQAQGIPVNTADFLLRSERLGEVNHYWSFGRLDNYERLATQPNVRLRGFVLFEPPLVLPETYRLLPNLTENFETVYVHNIVGEGYATSGVKMSKLRKLFWPQPHDRVSGFWETSDRQDKAVVISGNHNPRHFRPELYSERIRAIVSFQRKRGVDLYGRGWNRPVSRQSLWWPFLWRNYGSIRKAYRGSCKAKDEVLSRYRYSICLENMPMAGYITEKIFDCFYAGTVPLYLGAPDVSSYIPEDCYVDLRKLGSWESVHDHVRSMTAAQWNVMKTAGKAFVEGPGFQRFYNALTDMVQVEPAT